MAAVMNERATTRNGVPAEVHALLTVWGRWRQRGADGPGGYPHESPFIKAALYGKLGIPQESNIRIDNAMPAVVEWMDKIVTAMPTEVQHLKDVIEMRYKPPLSNIGHEPSEEKKARMLGMSVSTFRNRLESAQWYVFARMY